MSGRERQMTKGSERKREGTRLATEEEGEADLEKQTGRGPKASHAMQLCSCFFQG